MNIDIANLKELSLFFIISGLLMILMSLIITKVLVISSHLFQNLPGFPNSFWNVKNPKSHKLIILIFGILLLFLGCIIRWL